MSRSAWVCTLLSASPLVSFTFIVCITEFRLHCRLLLTSAEVTYASVCLMLSAVLNHIKPKTELSPTEIWVYLVIIFRSLVIYELLSYCVSGGALNSTHSLTFSSWKLMISLHERHPASQRSCCNSVKSLIFGTWSNSNNWSINRNQKHFVVSTIA